MRGKCARAPISLGVIEKMKKFYFLNISILLALVSVANAGEITGIYVTKPEIFPGFKKPYSEQIKKTIKLFTWKMEIKEKEIFLHLPKREEPLMLPYKIEGNYILCWESDEKIKKYIPFYIDDKKRLHGFNTIFYRME